MKQQTIMKELRAAFCNSPPSRLQHLSAEALNGFTTKEIEGLIAKLETTVLFLKNQKKIRENHVQWLEASTLSELDKKLLTISTHKGHSNGALR